MSIKQTLTIGVMAFGLFFAGCQESGMEANQDSAQVPAGTQLHVRMNPASSGTAYKDGDEFHGTLDRALEVNGQTIAPAGTMVHGEYTNDLESRDRASRDADRETPGTAGDSGDPTIAGRDDADRSRTDADRRADDRGYATGDRTDRERLGVELAKIVINGEEYDIDTEPVPISPAGAAGGMSSTMVFTLSDDVEIPTGTSKSE